MEETKKELERVCKKIAKLPFRLVPNKEEMAEEERLWQRKRELLAKLNSYNNDKLYA